MTAGRYRDLEEKFRERGFEVDHSTINRWVLACAPMDLTAGLAAPASTSADSPAKR